LWLAFGYRARTYLSLGTIILWALVVIRVTPHEYLGIRLGMILRFCLVVLPIIPFSLYVAGYNSGRERTALDQKFGTISVRGSETQYQLKANVVRLFEKSAIIIDENHRVMLLKPDDIARVERAEFVSINRGLLCDYWHISCPAFNTRSK